MTKLLIHTASLFQFGGTLDDKIHLALDAGLDGVELSDGPDIIDWKPLKETVHRLHDFAVTVHAELYPNLGVTLVKWTKAISQLPWRILNATFHPDELYSDEFALLPQLPFPCSIENMDATRYDWRTCEEVSRVMYRGVGLTLDTAHAEENGLTIYAFEPLFLPHEMHLSASSSNVAGYDYSHSLVHLRPDDVPRIVSGCPLTVLEGVVPLGGTFLEDEVKFVRRKLENDLGNN